MMTPEGRSRTGIPAKKPFRNTGMIVTAFGFMILMLVLTAPAAGPGPAPGIDHNPLPAPENTTAPMGCPVTPLPMTGPGPALDPVMEQVRMAANLSLSILPRTSP